MEWLEYAAENPIPEMLIEREYDDIETALAGGVRTSDEGGTRKRKGDEDEDDEELKKLERKGKGKPKLRGRDSDEEEEEEEKPARKAKKRKYDTEDMSWDDLSALDERVFAHDDL